MEGVAAREWPADPRTNMSAHWWSIPPHEFELDEQCPVGLALVEDRSDWERADCADIVVPDGLDVLEIWGPEDWAALCRRYPLPVTASKKHDWFRTTGRYDVEWVMPDWQAVAEANDVVHLPVVGWLRTAGIAVPGADGVASVLAGWDPDAAFWLTSCPAHVGQPVEWVFADDFDDRSLRVRPER